MPSRDLVGGVASVVIGAVYLYFAYQLRSSALDDTMGPGGMPQILGWLLVGLGVLLTIQSLVRAPMAAAANADTAEAPKGEWAGQGRKVFFAAGLLAIGIIYLFIVQTLGYVLSIALLIMATAAYLGAGLRARVVAIGIGGAIFLYAMFVLLLGVRMPAGILSAFGL